VLYGQYKTPSRTIWAHRAELICVFVALSQTLMRPWTCAVPVFCIAFVGAHFTPKRWPGWANPGGWLNTTMARTWPEPANGNPSPVHRARSRDAITAGWRNEMKSESRFLKQINMKTKMHDFVILGRVWLRDSALLLMAVPFVCPSVRHTRDPRLNGSRYRSKFLHHTIERCLYFLETKFRGREFRGSLRTSVLKRGTLCWKRKLHNHNHNHNHNEVFV